MDRADKNMTKTAGDQKAKILQLPVELVLMITGELPLHARFLLSRTCIALRVLTARDCNEAIVRLKFQKRYDFWFEVAYSLPDYWPCKVCCRLHRMDTSDLPQHGSVPSCQKGEVREFDCLYKLRLTHVLLALKLSRRGDVNQEYLRKMMAPFTLRKGALMNRSLHRYQATPKVVNGRFLLKTEWTFQRHNYERVVLDVLDEFCAGGICSHLFVSPDWSWMKRICRGNRLNYSYFSDISFERNIRKAENARKETRGYCRNCHTYYTIRIDKDAAIVCAYCDLGGSGNVRSLWEAHSKEYRWVRKPGPPRATKDLFEL
ncbi:f-box domain containing protein [Colletotrichum chrysophilum]|uniref:F-box domain containing protein n=1 Tax=Colletotrichum chrysophilum TaxID=1836956 RepID=A0AAD9EJ02_9PEZI|nr:f-box domain containing protein [Colletotrichum chrysophilum]